MTCWLVLLAAGFLSLERLCYVYISRAPEHFRRVCTRSAVAYLGEPVDVVRKLFYGFKGLQCAVFFGWCYVHGLEAPVPLGSSLVPLVIGIALIVAGQVLNWGVFYRLGMAGVFYGHKLGYNITWSRAFPFSWLKHPQYVGTVWSIWGLFLIMRFPRAIGYTSFGAVQGARGRVKGVALRTSPQAPAVTPTPETIRDQSYALARILHLLVTTHLAASGAATVVSGARPHSWHISLLRLLHATDPDNA